MVKATRVTDADGWVAPGWSKGPMRAWTAARHPVRRTRNAVRRQRGVSAGDPSVVPAGANEILERLAELPISVWTYGFDHESVRHLGPMAQDFARAFGLGDDDRRIDLVDANGVTMAAVQALYRRVVDLEAEVAELRAAAGAGPMDTHPADATAS